MESVSYSDLLVYAFIDPAGGKRQQLKRVRARSAIVVVGADYMERLFVLHTWADRASTPQILEKVFAINERFKPRRFGCEANALQSLFADAIRYIAKERGLRIPLTPVEQPTKITKEFRVRSILQPIIGNGRLFLQPNQHELRTEITAFPTGLTVDLVDALASVAAMVPPISKHALEARADIDLHQYLIDSGLGEDEIALTVADLEREDGNASVVGGHYRST
jgi:hypothetical protein